MTATIGIITIALFLLAVGGILYMVGVLLLALATRKPDESVDEKFRSLFFGDRPENRWVKGGVVRQLLLLTARTVSTLLVAMLTSLNA